MTCAFIEKTGGIYRKRVDGTRNAREESQGRAAYGDVVGKCESRYQKGMCEWANVIVH